MNVLSRILIMMFLLIAVVAQSAVPINLDYQAYLTDASGAPINGAIAVNVGLWVDPVDTSQDSYLYSEQHDNVPVNQGLFDLKIGNGISDNQGDQFESSFFDEPQLWIQIEINGETLSPRRALSSAAYSLRSESADSVKPNSITTSEIVDSTITGADVDNFSLSRVDIVDNAAGDFIGGDQFTSIGFTPFQYRSILLTAGASGVALIQVSATVFLEPGDLVTCGITDDASIDNSHQIQAGSTDRAWMPISAVRGFNVPGAGNYTFQFVCFANATSGNTTIRDSAMTALFAPDD